MRGLYAITPETLDTTKLIEQVRYAIAGGASVLQYRSKRVPPDVVLTQAGVLRKITKETGTIFIVNDNSDLAFMVGADGVHLGRDESDERSIFRIRQESAKRTPLQPFLIGVSCYNELSRAEEAVRFGADYIAFGSFFSSPTKPLAVKADLALLRAARPRIGLPIVAIGGITVGNAPQLTSVGVDMVAVITALFGADDIERRAREFTNLFEPEPHVCK
ncbi:MAG: thiamine phosphate synthase [Aeromicrobium sp.]|nr:thiamine phosphate synthase [Burkholderiales bacterium]